MPNGANSNKNGCTSYTRKVTTEGLVIPIETVGMSTFLKVCYNNQSFTRSISVLLVIGRLCEMRRMRY